MFTWPPRSTNLAVTKVTVKFKEQIPWGLRTAKFILLSSAPKDIKTAAEQSTIDFFVILIFWSKPNYGRKTWRFPVSLTELLSVVQPQQRDKQWCYFKWHFLLTAQPCCRFNWLGSTQQRIGFCVTLRDW